MIELIFKKYFWVLTGLTTAVLALLVALTINGWIETKIGGLGPLSTRVPRPAKTGDLLSSVRANDADLAEILIGRRFHNSEAPPEPEKEAEPVADEGGAGEDLGQDGDKEEEEIPLSDLQVNLLGTLVSTVRPTDSLCTVDVAGEARIAQVGTELQDGVVIKHIARKFILVSRGDDVERIRLWADRSSSGARRFTTKRGGRSSYRPLPTRARARASSPLSSGTDYNKGVTKKGEYEYSIDRSMLNEQLSDLTALGMQARVIPNYRGGRYDGFKLVGVRPNSLYRAIGVRSGDVIKAVNGDPIDSPNKALKLFEQLRSSRKIQLNIERHGMKRTLFYQIQ